MSQSQKLHEELAARSNLTKDAEAALRTQASNGMRQYLEKAHEIRRLQTKQTADEQIIEAFKKEFGTRRTLQQRIAELHSKLTDGDQHSMAHYLRIEARVADLARQERETVALIEQFNSTLGAARLSQDNALAGASTTPPSLASLGDAIESVVAVAQRGTGGQEKARRIGGGRRGGPSETCEAQS
ncbi:hypothetical protein AAF712_007987 [Marasmius tenuissimus]|uniref:Uncharacterized protein n=1 Tax=Marasmius tenuissimus TaxID=585030 RepID=A0ABR2ZV62_9AGAR